MVWANDISKEAATAYRANISDKMNLGDITNIDIASIPAADVLIGGPPCQPFSMIGKRATGDKRSDLVWQFCRAVKTVNPTVFVMENVVGLKSATDISGRSILEQLIKEFNSYGYSVSWTILNAANYGVPQLRKRLFIMGNRDGKFLRFPDPVSNEVGSQSNGFVTVEQAIGDLPSPLEDRDFAHYMGSPASVYQDWARMSNGKTVQNHQLPHMSELDKLIISSIPPGGNYKNVPSTVPSKRIQKFKETGGRTTTYGRLRGDRPSYTINTYFNRPNVGCNIHHKEPRLITIREGLRLQSFPDNFIIPKNLSKSWQYTLVGNAVPPLLALAVAMSLRAQL